MSLARPAAVLGGSYLGATVIPTAIGVSDEEGSKSKRLLSTGLGAATGALVGSPQLVLPRTVRAGILRKAGRPAYKKLERYGPGVVAGWGGVSGLASHEMGRALNIEKKAMKTRLMHLRPLLQEARDHGVKIKRVDRTKTPAILTQFRAHHNDALESIISQEIHLPKITKRTRGFRSEPKIRAAIAHELGHATGFKKALGKPLKEHGQTFERYVINTSPHVPKKNTIRGVLGGQLLREHEASVEGIDILKRHNLLKDPKRINKILSKWYNTYASRAEALKARHVEGKGMTRSILRGLTEKFKTKRFDI